jgi:lysozyme family protein
LKFVLRWEGGFVDDPDDPGGKTNKGITHKVYEAYLKSKGKPNKDVKNITDQEVEAIYWELYWTPARCGELPDRLAVAHMDTAVNMGVPRAIRILQQSLGVEADGKFGKDTRAAVESSDSEKVLAKYLVTREARYRAIATGKLKKFLKGWLNRLKDLKTYLTTI